MKTLFTNANIYSPRKLRADSIAVCNSRIIEIGTKTRLINLKRHGYSVIDLKGRTVLPGFIDSHVHLLSAGFNLLNVSFADTDSLEKVAVKISRAVKKISPGQWLIGRGWNKNNWGNKFPGKSILDEVCPDDPACFFSKDGHTIWVNSTALHLCSIDNSTPDPEGGAIMRNPDDSPTGILFESAVDLILSKVPQPSNESKLKALKKATKMFNSFGITGVGDCGDYSDRFHMLLSAREKNFLNLRVFMMLSPDEIDSSVRLGLSTGFGDDYITIGALKLYQDGALGSQTAWMHSPYENQQGNFGISALTSDELEMYFEKTHLRGISLAVHAIGDRANSEALEFFGKKKAVSRKLGLQHRIEHAQHLRKIDIPRFKKYNVAASVQPVHLIADRDMTDKHLGKRAKQAYIFNDLLKSGAKLGFGSDCPIESPDPFLGIYAATARKAPDDKRQAWYSEQALTLPQAFEAYTIGSARICSWESRCGVIAPGAWADFVVISDDLFKTRLENIPRIKVLATIFNGSLVYKSKDFKL